MWGTRPSEQADIRDGRLWVSVHLPKTAGTSFRETLQQIAGRNLFLDYQDRPLGSEYTRRRLGNLKADHKRYRRIVAALRGAKAPVIVHGHFLAPKYDPLFPGSIGLIWLRHPIQRLVSHYHHWQRHPDPEHDVSRWMQAEQAGLEELAAHPRMRNLYTRFLCSKRLDAFGFIGISEEYERSIRLFRKIFALPDGPAGAVMANANPHRSQEGYRIEPESLERIEKHHEQDLEIYQQGRRLFRERCREHGID